LKCALLHGRSHLFNREVLLFDICSSIYFSLKNESLVIITIKFM
jgi:hypothetical protein